MNARTWGAVAVLGASLGLDAYLLLARGDAKPEAPPRHRGHVASTVHASVPAPASAEPPTKALSVPAEIHVVDRAALEKRLAEVEAQVEQLLPLPEKYARDARTPENEARVRPFLDHVFETKPGEQPEYDVECHGRVCELFTDVSPSEWARDLQTGPERWTLFDGMSFRGRSAYMQVATPGQEAGARLGMALLTSFSQSPAVARCKQDNPDSGVVLLALGFDPSTRKLQSVVGGSLGTRPVGVCLQRALDDVIAQTPVPDDVTSIFCPPITVSVP